MDALARVNALQLPFAELMGIEFTQAAPDRVVGEMTVRAPLCTRPAVLHGAAIARARPHPTLPRKQGRVLHGARGSSLPC